MSDSCRPQSETAALRKRIRRDVAKYRKRGGKVDRVPIGRSGFEPVNRGRVSIHIGLGKKRVSDR